MCFSGYFEVYVKGSVKAQGSNSNTETLSLECGDVEIALHFFNGSLRDMLRSFVSCRGNFVAIKNAFEGFQWSFPKLLSQMLSAQCKGSHHDIRAHVE